MWVKMEQLEMEEEHVRWRKRHDLMKPMEYVKVVRRRRNSWPESLSQSLLAGWGNMGKTQRCCAGQIREDACEQPWRKKVQHSQGFLQVAILDEIVEVCQKVRCEGKSEEIWRND